MRGRSARARSSAAASSPRPEPAAVDLIGSGAAVEIRPFAEADLGALERAMPSVHHRGRAAAHRSGEATFLVAWHERRPVGHLLLKWDGSDAESVRRRLGRMPELNAIIVIPPLRSRGIGSRLIAAAERLVAARGIGCAGL